MTPDQIALVEDTVLSIDLDRLAADFYDRAFATEPSLATMFASDPAVQRMRFAAELGAIVRSIRSLGTFRQSAADLGIRHRGYGVRAADYRLMGAVLLTSLREALGPAWTDEAAEAWALAYNLIAEAMLLGAISGAEPGCP